MLFRGYHSGDELAHAQIRRRNRSLFPGLPDCPPEELLEEIAYPDPDTMIPIYAEDESGLCGAIVLRPNGRISVPEVLPERPELAVKLIREAVRVATGRGIRRAVAVVPSRWSFDESFRSEGFEKFREIVSFAQPAMDLPTAVGRFSTRFQPATAGDFSEIEFMALGIQGFTGLELTRTLGRISDHSLQPPTVMRRPSGGIMGVGWLMENDSWPTVEVADPLGCDLRLGGIGCQNRATLRVNGTFSFLAASPMETVSVGLDLLGHLTSEMNSSEIRTIATQVPADASHLLSFYNRYFTRQGLLSLYEYETGA